MGASYVTSYKIHIWKKIIIPFLFIHFGALQFKVFESSQLCIRECCIDFKEFESNFVNCHWIYRWQSQLWQPSFHICTKILEGPFQIVFRKSLDYWKTY